MEISYTVKILAAYPDTMDYDCTEETITPGGISTIEHPGNLPKRAGELLSDGWTPISGVYVYTQPNGPARTQLALRKRVAPV